MGDREGPDDETVIRLYARARRVAVRVAGEQVAPDIAAEVMVRMLTRWERVNSYAERWVTAVAANASIDHLRRRAAPLPQPLPVEFEEALGSRLLVVSLLRRLSRRQREVVVLHYLVGLDTTEVAAVLGLGLPSVKTHLARAMAALRQEAGKQETRSNDLHVA